MGKWTKAAVYSLLTAVALWWVDPSAGNWSTVVGNAALMVAPFRALIAIEDRFGCPLCRLWS